MTGPLVTAPLQDLVARGICYGIVQPGNADSSGVPIVRVGDVRNGLIDRTSPLLVTTRIADQFQRSRLAGGEVVVTLVGTVGEAAIVPQIMAGWNVARAIAVLRPTSVSGEWLRRTW